MKNFKRLFFDLELIPCEGWFWRTGKQVVTYKQIFEENRIICLAYKWEHEKKTHILYWDKNQCDKKLVEEFQKIAEQADIIIGQNSDRFDIRHVAARLAKHSAKPFNFILSEDTFKQARQLALPAYGLDYLGQYFGVGKKVETGGIELWLDVWKKKCPKALKQMSTYCKQDVRLCQAVWERIYPYVKHKGNYAILNEDSRLCPNCGKNKLEKRGYYYTKAGKKQIMICTSCRKCCNVGANLIKKPGEYPR